MLLRRTIDRLLPYRRGDREEVRLSPAARDWVFSTEYLLWGKVVRCTLGDDGYGPSEEQDLSERPQRTERETRHRQRLTFVSYPKAQRSADEWEEAEHLLNDPNALRRVNRVERVARVTKVVAGIALVVCGVYGYNAAEHAITGAIYGPPSGLEQCVDADNGGHALVPTNMRPDVAKRLGERICQLGEDEYLIVPAEG